VLIRIENAENQKEIFRIMDSERVNLSLTRRQYRDFLHVPVSRIAEALQAEAAAQKPAKDKRKALDAERLAWLIADMTRGTIQRRLLGQSEWTPAEEANFLMKVLLPSLGIKHR
jgi:hypothetical protein